MFSMILSAAVIGVEAKAVQVEADVCDGLPMFCMVGDLSTEVREAADRVRTALRNTGIAVPPKRVTVNLSPAHIRKEGTRYDLPVAAALLAALGVFPAEYARNIMIVGEVGLNGQIYPVDGVLQTVLLARELKCSCCLVPKANAGEGAAVPEMSVIGIESIRELLECLLSENVKKSQRTEVPAWHPSRKKTGEDFREVNGQFAVRRAAEIAAAGMHNLLMIGSPGAGKTMIARRMPSILPELTLEESLKISKVYSACGLLAGKEGLMTERPFRSPHHTVSANALTGGGRKVRPGEISLATGGILFLDELPEFSKNALEVLRQPMEEGRVVISRTDGTYEFPAEFQLVAAMNPCKCGYYPDRSKCHCLPGEVAKYVKRISRPLLDRIDICVEIPRVEYRDLTSEEENESSAKMRKRVEQARQIQEKRYEKAGWKFNSRLGTAAIREFCPLGTDEQKLMELAFERMNLSARGYHRVIKVARTIADLAGEETIRELHLLEALGYRSAYQKFWE